MKRVAIFLRKDIVNKFRRAIIETLKSEEVDEALLCSGFFQHTHNYQAGLDLDISKHRSSTPLKLTVMGIYSYTWKQQYIDFFNQLSAINAGGLFSATQKKMKGMRWHAKIFIAKKHSNPLVAIIGSSNITSRAFGEHASFNYECDVIFWEEKNSRVNRIIESVIGDDGDSSGVIVTNYDESHRVNQLPLEKRLLDLEKEILARSADF